FFGEAARCRAGRRGDRTALCGGGRRRVAGSSTRSRRRASGVGAGGAEPVGPPLLRGDARGRRLAPYSARDAGAGTRHTSGRTSPREWTTSTAAKSSTSSDANEMTLRYSHLAPEHTLDAVQRLCQPKTAESEAGTGTATGTSAQNAS